MSDSCELSPFALIMGLATRIQATIESAAAEIGLTGPQAQVLAQLEVPRRMGDIAQQQTCDPSSVTTMMQRLERDGLVVRIVDATDARARLVELTAKGRLLREQFLVHVGDGSEVIDALPDIQRSALVLLFSAPGRSPETAASD